MQSRRSFILFEGIDGSGKTTAIKTVSEMLSSKFHITLLNEPTNGEYGKRIRELQSQPVSPPIDKIMDLYLKDRHMDVFNNLLPALENNMTVLMDRYYYSNAAYQGAMGLSPELILEKNREKNFPEPDLLIFLDLNPEISLERAKKRISSGKSQRECFEKLDFLKKVREIYLKIIPEKSIIIDADAAPDIIAENIYKKIIEFLNE